MTFSTSRIRFVVMASFIKKVVVPHVVGVVHILKENNFVATGLSEINERIGIDSNFRPFNSFSFPVNDPRLGNLLWNENSIKI